MDGMIAFGPVPSRRLGQSLGINNIPPKICSYACVYCQLGPTIKMQVSREVFYPMEEILDAVRIKIGKIWESGGRIDYLTFVPDGEPTLDINLGETIAMLGDLEIPIAVISNASLMDQQPVREALLQADWVSLKVDSVRPETWRRIDRPHGRLHLEAILEGIHAFADDFNGLLATETMLLRGLNDHKDEIREVARFLGEVAPDVSYLTVPTRPPAEAWVKACGEAQIQRAFQEFSAVLERVELLLGYEGNAFASSGQAEEDLLSITAVHPMRKDAVDQLLVRDGADWSVVDRLIEERKLVELEYEDQRFYLRRIRR